jgi:hypothetical protein
MKRIDPLFPSAPSSGCVANAISTDLAGYAYAAYPGYGDDDLAVLGYYGPIGAMSSHVGAGAIMRHPMPHARHPMPHPHAAHPHVGIPPLPYPPAVAQRMFNPAPGAPSHQAGMRPMTLLNGSFINGGATNLPFSQTPRHQFQGRQLTYTERRTAAAATLAIFVSIDNLAVGGNLQGEAAGAWGADTFLQSSFERDLKLTPCSPGVFITGNVIASAAPGAAEVITFSLTLHGETLY